MTTKSYLQYAVEMHDLDAAMTTLVEVYLLKEKASDELAEKAAKRSHGWISAGNTVEYASEGPTGKEMVICYHEDGTELSRLVIGESRFAEASFYQMME